MTAQHPIPAATDLLVEIADNDAKNLHVANDTGLQAIR